MGIVIADISISLDGFVAGPSDSPDPYPLGVGGERLHQWMYELESWRAQVGRDGGEGGAAADLMGEYFARMGSVLIGRRMFDHGERPWGDEPPFRVPVFVVTHRPRPTEEKLGGTTFTFVTEGVASAVKQAKEAAGAKDVALMGGARVIESCLAAGLLDELRLHQVPVFLGGGVRLFEPPMDAASALEPTRAEISAGVTHLFFRTR